MKNLELTIIVYLIKYSLGLLVEYKQRKLIIGHHPLCIRNLKKY